MSVGSDSHDFKTISPFFSFLMFFLLSCGHAAGEELSDSDISRAVQEISGSLPMRVDGVTVLTSVRFLSPSIVYEYSLDVEGVLDLAARQQGVSAHVLKEGLEQRYGSVNEGLRMWKTQNIDPLYVERFCTNPAVFHFLESGYTVDNQIYDLQGRYFHSVLVGFSSCR